MRRALEMHRNRPKDAKPPERPKKPLRAEDYPAAKRLRRNECIHCHQVNEFRREARQASGEWKREDVWVYPLPENVGITLDVDRCNAIKAVAADSPAAKVGVRPGDVLRKLNGLPVVSFADAQFALNKAPAKGEIPVEWLRGDKPMSGTLTVPEGWRKTNVTWRPSMLDILPALPVSGEDLTPEEKKKLGLPAKRVAVRQDKFVHSTLKAVGLLKDDVIVGIDGKQLDGTMEEFLGYVRQNYLVGDKVTLNVLRDGKRVDLPLTLK